MPLRHGKGRVREFFVGSVANYCLHRCKKPVVIFRSPPVAEHKSTVRPGQSPHFPAEYIPETTEVTPTGSRARAWCLLIHAEASNSLK